MALCPNCGRRIRGEMDFCPYCNEEIFYNANEYRRDRQRSQRDARKREERHSSRSTSDKKKERKNDVRSRQSGYSASPRRTAASGKSSSGGRSLVDEVKRLRKKTAVLTLSLVGVSALAVILGFGFITTAMNISSLTLKAKNTEEKLQNIMDEYNALRGEDGTYGSEEESKNPFKADIAAANEIVNKSGELPVPASEETTESVQSTESEKEENNVDQEEKKEEPKDEIKEEKKETQQTEQKKEEQKQNNEQASSTQTPAPQEIVPQTEELPTVPEETPAESDNSTDTGEANAAGEGTDESAPLIPD